MTIVAIDGPSGSGKSTTARLVAGRIGLSYLDTGAMYRAVALVALQRSIVHSDTDALTKIAAEMKLQMLDEASSGDAKPKVMVNGADATELIRTLEVTQMASAVAVHSGVRNKLVLRQRNWVEERGGAVVEGRDIGTVVFPEADLKIYLTADESERAQRRQSDADASEFAVLESKRVEAEIAERDARDSGRVVAPLAIAPDAVLIDTTKTDIEEVVLSILAELQSRLGGQLIESPGGRLDAEERR